MKKQNKVIFKIDDEDVARWGGNDNPHGLLVVGNQYTVKQQEVHSWHTKFILKEFPDKKFNAAHFTAA